MPRDSQGIYTLPPGYEAIPGETILPSQHNPPLQDIASALTGSLPRSGSAPMLAPLRLADGSAGAPSLAFNSAAGTGLFKTANGIGFAIGGVQVAEFSTGGLLGLTPIGGGMDFYGTVAPSGWIFPYGQALSRTGYAALWAAMGSPNTGDGSTTFTAPDKRGRASFGIDNMGGTAANRSQVSTTITTTNASATATVASATGLTIGMTVVAATVPAAVTITAIVGTTLTLSTDDGVTAGAGAARFSWLGDAQAIASGGGEQAHTTTLPETAPHNHGGVTTDNGQHQHGVAAAVEDGGTGANSAGGVKSATNNNLLTQNAGLHNHSIPNAGGGLAHNNLPPGIVCNHIIFAGV